MSTAFDAMIDVMDSYTRSAWASALSLNETWQLPERVFVALLMWLALIVVYVGCNIPYQVLYTLRIPFFEQYKIQKSVPHHSAADYKKCAQVVLFNLFVLSPPLLLTLPEIAMLRGGGFHYDVASLPSWRTLAWHQLVHFMAFDLFFSVSHYTFHSKYFYKRVHKQHHEFTAPMSWSSIYAHPAEYIISDFFSLALGCVILKAHLASLAVFMVLRLLTTSEIHSGYDFPWSLESLDPIGLYAGARAHDYHHETFLTNYADIFTVFDRIMGTRGIRPSDKDAKIIARRRKKEQLGEDTD